MTKGLDFIHPDCDLSLFECFHERNEEFSRGDPEPCFSLHQFEHTRSDFPGMLVQHFARLIAFFEKLGFTCRERFYAGKDAGWVAQILDHPAAREWEKAALAETWREAEHEAELAAAGTITADYRA